VKDQSDHPVFRGPEGSGFDVNELKKITVDIRRNLPVDMVPIERSIINPEDVVLVRRPGM
jgi:Sex determination protein N terminal.